MYEEKRLRLQMLFYSLIISNMYQNMLAWTNQDVVPLGIEVGEVYL